MGQVRTDSAREITITGILEDGPGLNAAVKELRELGVASKDLTVVLKRKNTSSDEPFPEGTRYIVIPDDRRGLEVPLGFSIAFIIFGIFFAITTPSLGIPTLAIFIALAAILWAGALVRVGVMPILTDMGAPSDEADTWNEEFELGKVLVFVTLTEHRLIRPIREILQRHGSPYYLSEGRLEPRALHQAMMRRVGARNSQIGNRVGSYEDM